MLSRLPVQPEALSGLAQRLPEVLRPLIGNRLGSEVAPGHMSDRTTARTLGWALGLDSESDEIAEKLAERRYAMTGDYRAIEKWEAEARARQ
ncbi:hypothetical protein ABZ419_26720 [Streptomyces cinnamoneus]|uniref:hypothetical protein n=1 Tax=Streptomyces cinnamoneus TaxID=53446 RepID=UPI0033DE57D2